MMGMAYRLLPLCVCVCVCAFTINAYYRPRGSVVHNQCKLQVPRQFRKPRIRNSHPSAGLIPSRLLDRPARARTAHSRAYVCVRACVRGSLVSAWRRCCKGREPGGRVGANPTSLEAGCGWFVARRTSGQEIRNGLGAFGPARATCRARAQLDWLSA